MVSEVPKNNTHAFLKAVDVVNFIKSPKFDNAKFQ